MLRTASKLIASMAIGFSVAAVAITYSNFASGAAASFAPKGNPALVEATQAVCENLGKARYVSGCHINERDSFVNFTLNVSTETATGICADIGKQLAERTRLFGSDRWSVSIFSPYKTRPLTSCGIG
jgi:hypothetical protein